MVLDGSKFDSAATEHEASNSGENSYIDIGGFGAISGCVQKMNSSNQQVVRDTLFIFNLINTVVG